MQLRIKPQKVIPASYSVIFDEDRDYSGYVIQPQPYEDALSADISTWLDSNAPGYVVSFDRGDWGDGPAVVKINFETQAQAHAFQQEFNRIPCLNARSRGDCSHIGSALSLINRESGDGRGTCEHCGYTFQILTRSNKLNFLASNEDDVV
jgi:hypothetical protein